MTDMNTAVPGALYEGPTHPFSAWPDGAPPREDGGIYTIWQGEQFLYVGIGPTGNLRARLKQHCRGDLGGDQFNVYVFGICILGDIASGRVRVPSMTTGADVVALSGMVRNYIVRHLSYRWYATDLPNDLARQIRGQGLFGGGAGKPAWNPD
jgi:hypothetical protein